jgi:hypothetical protein
VLKNSVHTSKETQHFAIKNINWLMLFKEIIPVYTENYTRLINTKFRVIDRSSQYRVLTADWMTRI